tara:strand:- start:303 stop:431 length:129 start_codon:yes stop_codon:yes gene_type:complete
VYVGFLISGSGGGADLDFEPFGVLLEVPAGSSALFLFRVSSL